MKYDKQFPTHDDQPEVFFMRAIANELAELNKILRSKKK
jgi:hypothetical protein